jgi:hypothetical protein
MCISDPGRCNPSIADLLLPLRLVYTTPLHPKGRCVAILLADPFSTVTNTFTDPSGAVLAVDVKTGVGPSSSKLTRIIAIYQPPGIDDVCTLHAVSDPPIGTFEPKQKSTPRANDLLQESHRLRQVVSSWATSPDVACTVCAGDSNQTLVGSSDRIINAHSPRYGRMRFGPLHLMLEDDNWSDIYRHSILLLTPSQTFLRRTPF